MALGFLVVEFCFRPILALAWHSRALPVVQRSAYFFPPNSNSTPSIPLDALLACIGSSALAVLSAYVEHDLVSPLYGLIYVYPDILPLDHMFYVTSLTVIYLVVYLCMFMVLKVCTNVKSSRLLSLGTLTGCFSVALLFR